MSHPSPSHSQQPSQSHETSAVAGSTEGWTVTEENGALRVDSAALAFSVTPENAATVLAPQWKLARGIPAIVQLRVFPHYGYLYNPRLLNWLGQTAQGGVSQPLTWEATGDRLEIRGEWALHDLVFNTTWIASARTGGLELIAEARKTGPGEIKVQLMGQPSFAVAGKPGPPLWQVDFEVGEQRLTRSEYGAEGNIFDQDGHTTVRSWSLSSPIVRFRTPGATESALEAEIDTPLRSMMLQHSPTGRGIHAALYGPDQLLQQGDQVTSRWRLTPVAIGDAGQSGAEPRHRPEVAAEIDAEATQPLPEASPDDAVATFRRDLHAWKLDEARWYDADANPVEARALLRDAATIRRAVAERIPAALPERAGLLYEQSFRTFPTDWSVLGFGEIRSCPEEGLLVAPNTTVNLWSEREFSGDYLVELEYRPEPTDQFQRGTFLQLSGRPMVERDAVDLMASATGHMPDYNFGVQCYHLSFNRRARLRSRTNFRKTGEAFRLLSLVEAATAGEPCWHTLTASKQGSHFLFYVDGRFVLEYFDEGHQGPFLDRGKIGLRNWGGMTSWFRNLKVFALRPS
ncbi:MAG TPA: DUF1961 family protein [Chthoniobacteraceae bacterium]|nr:DUF1961 family protein [Chthoniobacteraceae bacterium]